MDAQVGALLNALAKDGLADNTIVIWTTDHGDGLPRAKRELFDSGLHVPVLVHFPSELHHQAPAGWQPGSASDRLVSFVDFAPTLLNLAGLPRHALHHGRNFLTASERRYLYASRDRIDEVPDRQRAIRDARYKYIRSYAPDIPGGHTLAYRDLLGSVRAMRAHWQAGKATPEQASWFQPTPEHQLYDLQNDPHEVINLAGRPEYRQVQRRLARALARRLREIGDTSDTPEPEMRRRLLTENGEVPVTPSPRIRLQRGRYRITASDNASIGYRVDEGPWQLYRGPLELKSAGATLEARAVRYGLAASPVVTRRLAD